MPLQLAVSFKFAIELFTPLIYSHMIRLQDRFSMLYMSLITRFEACIDLSFPHLLFFVGNVCLPEGDAENQQMMLMLIPRRSVEESLSTATHVQAPIMFLSMAGNMSQLSCIGSRVVT